MKSDKPLYMPQNVVQKIVFSKENGGKHGLGRAILDELPYQLSDPMMITGNTTRHAQSNDNSVVVWTDWETEKGDSIIAPIRINVDGVIDVYNNINSVFDAYDSEYVADLLRDGNVLYRRNDGSTKTELVQQREVLKVDGFGASNEQSIAQPTAKSNSDTDIRFSMQDSVEETDKLLAIHNLTGEQLNGVLELGGFPIPSIAVLKATQGHDRYGDVSIVFGKETLNPKTNRLNKVYGGDAWTPNFPAVEYEVNSKAAEAIRRKYYELAERKGYDFVRPMYTIANTLEDELNRRGGVANTIIFLNIFKKAGKHVIMKTVMRNETFSNNRSGI